MRSWPLQHLRPPKTKEQIEGANVIQKLQIKTITENFDALRFFSVYSKQELSLGKKATSTTCCFSESS